eukprot:GHVT01081181.1.p1 GENE.GHVT01081181.1~~GHVT01081181.1.p1  ORF type:complete len:134 (-),score=20.47 GHVT01081181.1:436-837(-)
MASPTKRGAAAARASRGVEEEPLRETSLWTRAFQFNSEDSWEPDEAGDVLWWIKSFVGLLCGIMFGIANVQGYIGFILYLGIQFLVALAWTAQVPVYRVIFDSSQVFAEGLYGGFFTFLISWIASFTAVNSRT